MLSAVRGHCKSGSWLTVCTLSSGMEDVLAQKIKVKKCGLLKKITILCIISKFMLQYTCYIYPSYHIMYISHSKK